MSSGLAGDLAARLAGYATDDEDERHALDAMLALLQSDRAFASDRYRPGHITASAFVVHPERPAVGLIFHSKLQRWLQPGGHVESDDSTIVAAALREVREETGLGPAGSPWLCDLDVHVFPARPPHVPRHLHHDVRVAFVADATEPVAGDGVEAVRWWTFEDALDLERSIARPVAKLAKWFSGGN